MGNIGHFDNEIDMAGLESYPGIKHTNVKPQVDRYEFTDRPAFPSPPPLTDLPARKPPLGSSSQQLPEPHEPRREGPHTAS